MAEAKAAEKKTRRVTIDGKEYTEFTRANGSVGRVPFKPKASAPVEGADQKAAGESEGSPWPAVCCVAVSLLVLGGAGWFVINKRKGSTT